MAWIVSPRALGAIAASSTAPGYAAANIANDYAGVVWKSATGSATQTITLDLGANASIDTILPFGCEAADLATTINVDAATQAQGPGFGAGSFAGAVLPFLAGTTMPTIGRPIGWWQAPAAGGPPASRYWRITIGGLGGKAISVARLVIGKRLVLSRNFGFPVARGVRDFGSLDFSDRGVLMRRRGVKMRTLGLSFANVERWEAEDAVHPLLEERGLTEMIALVTDPAEHALRQQRCFYGPMLGDLGTVQRRANAWAWDVKTVSIF